MADLSQITPLAMEMPELRNQDNINLIARKGSCIRDELNRAFNIPKKNKLVFFYAGSFTNEQMRAELIGKNESHTIISFNKLKSKVKNYIYVANGEYRHQDIMASSDVAMIKPGYGMVSEALVNQVPIIHPPREDFAEYVAFTSEFEKAGCAELISRDDFEKGEWEEALSSIKDKKYKKKYYSDGAIECKRNIEKLF